VRRSLASLLARVGRVEASEVPLVRASAATFFCLLGGLFLLRPVREQFGVQAGLDRLPLLFLGTVVATLLAQPLHGWLVARVPRRPLLALSYRFLALSLVLFFALVVLLPEAGDVVVGRVYYVWFSVFNLFAVSIFWQLMADVWRPEQARRLYGLVGVGGTLGAVLGALASTQVGRVAGLLGVPEDDLVPGLLLGGALLLELAVRATRRVGDEVRRLPVSPEVKAGAALGGRAWEGAREVVRSPFLLGISGWVFLHALLGSLLYFAQAEVVAREASGPGERTEVFGWINFATQGVTLVVQLFFTGRILTALGVGRSLAVLPLVTLAGLGALALSPTLSVLVAVEVLRRGTGFGLANPAEQGLFAVLPREEKWKAKAFVDTFVTRTGDATAAALELLGKGAALATGSLFLVGAPATVAWAALSLWLGRERDRRAGPATPPGAPP
jgi:AAA family ATP:ADP antiporter